VPHPRFTDWRSSSGSHLAAGETRVPWNREPGRRSRPGPLVLWSVLLPAQKLRIVDAAAYAFAAIDTSLELSSEAWRHGERHASNAISICDLIPPSEKPPSEVFQRGDLNPLGGH
jgi:hypothetical protein